MSSLLLPAADLLLNNEIVHEACHQYHRRHSHEHHADLDDNRMAHEFEHTDSRSKGRDAVLMYASCVCELESAVRSKAISVRF